MTLLIEDVQPPAPYFVLRGHPSEVQCLHFPPVIQTSDDSPLANTLISGDASGFVIVWSMLTCRPLAIWQAHTSALLTVRTIGSQVLTHGRDNKLYLWTIIDLSDLSSKLPIDVSQTNDDAQRQKPFLLCSLDVNSLNFCQIALSRVDYSLTAPWDGETLVAVPGLLSSDYVDIFALPSTLRLVTRLQATEPSIGKLGNVMSIDFRYPRLVVGYENGAVALFTVDVSRVDRTTQKQDGQWECLKVWTQHREAVLSVVLNTEAPIIYSCGIDAKVIRYDYDSTSPESGVKEVQTKHSGQQSMRIRSDRKLIGTAGWDSYARIYTTSKLRSVAVLGHHRSALNAFEFQEKLDSATGLVALGSKDTKISLWKIF